MRKKYKYAGFALVGTVAAIVAWITMSYGMFMAQNAQFEMLISGKDSINAQKLAEVDGSLLRLVPYDELSNGSSLAELNLHHSRSAMKSVKTDKVWQDEIRIGGEKNNGTDSKYGNYRIATVNIYKEGDVTPRFSLQTPVLSYSQPYIRQEIDEFIEERKKKDRELEAKDRALESKDKQLEAKDKQLEAKDRELNSMLDSVESDIRSQLPLCHCPPCPLTPNIVEKHIQGTASSGGTP
ncbi:MAG: hypothetical protein IKN43_09625 [Selenomonadaceae bacterium]|nr:hypothetical protein [Selenomonadaceae bacterium]